MPIYDRSCDSCETLWEVSCKIAEKNNPHACPKCGKTEGTWHLGMPYTSVRPDRLMTAKKDNGFKEVLDKVKSRHGRTNLATGRNTGPTAMD